MQELIEFKTMGIEHKRRSDNKTNSWNSLKCLKLVFNQLPEKKSFATLIELSKLRSGYFNPRFSRQLM